LFLTVHQGAKAMDMAADENAITSGRSAANG
jgi:hypothetical protein